MSQELEFYEKFLKFLTFCVMILLVVLIIYAGKYAIKKRRNTG